MKIQKMHRLFHVFSFFPMLFVFAVCISKPSVWAHQEPAGSLGKSSGLIWNKAVGYTWPNQYEPQDYEAPGLTWFQKVLVAEVADAAPGSTGYPLPETHLPEQVPPEQRIVLPRPGTDTQFLTEPPDTEVQFSAPPKVPGNREPALPPAPEPSISSIASPLTALPPAAPPAEFSESELPPVLKPSLGDMVPTNGLIPSVSEPPSPPQGSTAEPALSALPEPAASPPPGSIITVRPFTPPQDRTQAPVQTPAPSAVPVPAPVQTPPPVQAPVPPEPPRFIRSAELEPPPQIAHQVLSQQGNPLPELPSQRSSRSVQREMQAKAAYSRTVQAIVGQMVEIPFRGTGWVYLGEQESRPGIAYDARRLEKEGQNFVFKTESPGTYILTFYKQDFIEDYMINDFVQVIVSPVPQDLGSSRTSLSADRGRVIAEPRWPPLPEDSTAPASIRLPPAELPPVAVPPPEVPPPTLPSIDYLQQAREAYTAGQFPQAISSLDQFQEQYPAGTDEAWWLYGQSLEAASPSRDIRSALDYYRRLIREYPQSPRGNDARRRIAYLDRYYFTIQ